MKNIHILPTDKPSNIVISTITGELKLNNNVNDSVEYHGQNQHIYITNDEEIKEGDWLIIIDDFETYVREHKGDNLPTTYHKKIILTTDQDLIKDGVQAIDDEFLEWFVNNPSCEWVEVIITPKIGLQSFDPLNKKNDLSKGIYKALIKDANEKIYKIIIPKTIQQIIDEDFAGGLDMGQIIPKDEPKQETTLEEAAREYYKRGQLGFEKAADTERAFLRGAKWQQERSYSEEEVIQLLDALWTELDIWYNKKDDEQFNLIRWFYDSGLFKERKI